MPRRKLTLESRQALLLRVLATPEDPDPIRFRPRIRRRDRHASREKPREISSTDINLDWSRWESPQLHFAVLLGESGAWDGPSRATVETAGKTRCRGCGHLKRMPSQAYCLHCDRCGRSHLIPTSGQPARDVGDDDDDLRGGLD